MTVPPRRHGFLSLGHAPVFPDALPLTFPQASLHKRHLFRANRHRTRIKTARVANVFDTS